MDTNVQNLSGLLGSATMGYAQQVLKHNHLDTCSHETKLCLRCDVVECQKCGKEWKTIQPQTIVGQGLHHRENISLCKNNV